MNILQLRFLLSFLGFLTATTPSFSQAKTGYFAGGGIMYYNGDLDDRTNEIFNKPDFFNLSFSAGVSQWLTGRVEGSLWLTHGKINGADSLSTNKDHLARNLSFESTIYEASVHFEFTAFHRFERRTINPFASLGVSVFQFNPKAELNGIWYELQPLGTEGQNINTGEYSKPYKLTQVAVPFGIGFSVQVIKHLRLKAELSHRLLFTDYLDDVSTVYPDVETLSSMSNGDVAVALSGKRLNGKYPDKNRPRGNPKFKDSYSTIGITLIFNPGIMKCPASFRSTRIKKT